MVNRETNRGKRAAFSARVSVEAIVVILVAAAAVAIFTVKAMAGGWEDSGSPGSSKVAGLRHDAISPASDPTTQDAGMTPAADQDKFSRRSANDRALKDGSNETVLRNGVTIESPPLLIPVISADAVQTANGSEALTSPRKAPNTRKRPHYANRAHTLGQRRVVRSAPFGRVVAR